MSAFITDADHRSFFETVFLQKKPDYWPPKTPIVVVDNVAFDGQLPDTLSGRKATVYNTNEKNFADVCRRLDVETVHFYEMRVADLSPLASCANLSAVAIEWNPKLVDLSPLAELARLQFLALKDTRRVYSLGVLEKLADLKGFAFGGGWTGPGNKAQSLSPLTKLPALEEVVLSGCKFEEDGLRPLANCVGLRRLSLPNTFDTDDYAFLKAKLPNVKCSHFAAYLKLRKPLDDRDVMVVGKRKPFLNSSESAGKLLKYQQSFDKMVDSYV